MKLLFIGGVFPKDKESEYYDSARSSFQAAANAWQWNVIEGLEDNLSESIDILNAVFLAPFPYGNKKVWEKSYEWKHSKGSKDYNISFLNLFMIKNIFREINLKRQLRYWIRENKDEELIVMAYSPHVPFLSCLKLARRKNALTCLILPDLLKFTGTAYRDNKVYQMIKKFEVKRFYDTLKSVDKFVLFTEAMAEDISIEDHYIIIEGIADPSLANSSFELNRKEKVILYTGSLHQKYGIKELVDSFQYIKNPDYRLIICGEGDAKDYIKSVSAADERIRFLGQVRREEIIRLQREATVLVNPRPNIGEYTKYSFPSKTMEYMLAANPVICHKLDGIPDEYDQYLIYFEDNDPVNIARKFVQIAELDPVVRRGIGEAGRDFIVNHKNRTVQTRKILEFLQS